MMGAKGPQEPERVDISLVSTEVDRGYREKALRFFLHGDDAVFRYIEMH
jgi:hypothetical protein